MRRARKRQPIDIERQVVAFLLAGEEPPFPTLRQQWDTAWVNRRAHLEWGLFTEIGVPSSVPRVEPVRFDLSDVSLDFENLDGGGYAAIFVNDGVLVSLEVAPWKNPWHASALLKSITYSRTVLPPTDDGEAEFLPVAERDWAGVRQDLAEAASWPRAV